MANETFNYVVTLGDQKLKTAAVVILREIFNLQLYMILPDL